MIPKAILIGYKTRDFRVSSFLGKTISGLLNWYMVVIKVLDYQGGHLIPLVHTSGSGYGLKFHPIKVQNGTEYFM